LFFAPSLKNQKFHQVTAVYFGEAKQNATAAALYYKHPLLDQDTNYSVPAGKERSGALAYAVPTGWKQAELRFFPDLKDTSKCVKFILTNR